MHTLIKTVLLATSLASVSPSSKKHNSSYWMDDYRQLKNSLERRYANLLWKASDIQPVNLPTLDRSARDALKRARSDDEAEAALRTFVEGFRDGHLSVLPTLARAIPKDSATAEPPRPGSAQSESSAACAARGYAPSGQTSFSLPFEQLDNFELLSDGVTSVFRTGLLIQSSGLALGLVRIQGFDPHIYLQACVKAWASKNRHRDSEDSFDDDTESIWVNEFARAIEGLKYHGAKAIIVDVGDNDGGDQSGDWFARLLTDRLIKSEPLLITNVSTSDAYFRRELASLRDAEKTAQSSNAQVALRAAESFFSGQERQLDLQPCSLSWVWRERREWAKTSCSNLIDAGFASGFASGLSRNAYNDDRVEAALTSASKYQRDFGSWTGPVFVLVNKRSYSSAEMFAAVLQLNGVAKVVGTETGGDGCGFKGELPPLVLTHSRLRLRIPNCVRIERGGLNEEGGVAPDIAILPTEGEGQLQRAERTAESIAIAMNGARL